MELKSDIRSRYAERERCFNRTFMELKLLLTATKAVRAFVLIVPLWN